MSDEAARIFERERRNRGLTVIEYIEYLGAESGQSIDDLIDALKAAKRHRWQLDVFGDLGGHWGRGFTPEEAVSNAIRLYCIGWQTNPEDGPVQQPPLPDTFNWRYRPEGSDNFYHVRPPQVDWDTVFMDFYEDLSGIATTLKKAMMVGGVINAQLMGDVTAMEELIGDWYFTAEENPGFNFCSHPDAEPYPQNGPNLSFCHHCQTMFRTDLP